MSCSLLLSLSSNGGLSSPSLRAGHCLDEPGTLGWKLYQAERKQNLKDLKANKLDKERAEEAQRNLQERVDSWNTDNERFEPYDPNYEPPILPMIVEQPKRPSLISRNYSRVPTAGSGRSAHVHFSEYEIFSDPRFNEGFAPYVPRRIRTQLTSEILTPGRFLPVSPIQSRTALKAKADSKKNKGSRSKTSVTGKRSAIKVKKSRSRPKVKKSNLDNVSTAARAGSVIGTSVNVKKSKSRSNVNKSNLEVAGALAGPGTKTATETSPKVKKSKSKANKSNLNVTDTAAGSGTAVTVSSPKIKNSKSRPKARNFTSDSTDATSKPGTAAATRRKSRIARPKKSSKNVGLEDNKAMALAAGLAETQIGTGDSTTGIKSQPTANSKRAPRFNFTPNTPLPGTPEWERYWKGYHKALAKFDKDMNDFSAGMEEYDEILAGYRKEASRITNEEKIFKAGLDFVGSSVFTPAIKPPPMRREPITETPIAFNGYVISSRKMEGTISNQLGMVNGIVIQVHIGTTDPDTLKVERDDHFFTLSFANKRNFLHICVPSGKSPNDVIMHAPIGGYVYVEGP